MDRDGNLISQAVLHPSLAWAMEHPTLLMPRHEQNLLCFECSGEGCFILTLMAC